MTGDTSTDQGNSFMNKKRKKNKGTDDSGFTTQQTVKDYDINVILTD